MKTRILFSVFFIGFLHLSAQHKKVSVLFIGNSYTAVNNLPLLIDGLVTAGGDTLDWDSNAPGGYTFKLHSTDATTLAKINLKQWDYVVLQEQSQLPSFPPATVDMDVIPYALILDSVIHANNPCTQVVFYETWGRKYGDASNCAFYPPLCTYDGMQQRLLESYKLMADTCHGIVAPVGEAYRNCIAYDTTVNLYQSDHSHPSLNGSFLAASVFYNIFMHKSAVGINYNPGVTQLTADQYHNFARQTVADSLNFWNLGIYEPWAEFTWEEIPGCNIVFNASSNSNFTHFWNFGDSTTSTVTDPVHHYLYSSYFPVLHIVYNGCMSDTFVLTNNMICNDGINEIRNGLFTILPNPVKENLVISNEKNFIKSVSVYNLTGDRIKDVQTDGLMNTVIIPASGYPSGMYFVLIQDDGGHFSSGKFVVMH